MQAKAYNRDFRTGMLLKILENFKNTSFTEQLRASASVAKGTENSVLVFSITIDNFKKIKSDDLRYLACT